MGGEISFDELAEQCGLFEADIRRVIRFAIAYHHICRERRKGIVAHSAASWLLVDGGRARDGLGVMFDDCYQNFGRVSDAHLVYRNKGHLLITSRP